jgi:hypothetical protein
MSQIMKNSAKSAYLGYLVNMTAGNGLKIMSVTYMVQDTGPPEPNNVDIWEIKFP